MKKKNKLTMNATLLRVILSVSILVVSGITLAGFIYSLGFIKSYASEVSHKKVDAQASNGNIQALEKVQRELDANSDVLSKIGLLKSTGQFPIFRIVDEVNEIAAKNNLVVEGTALADSAATATPGAAGGAATPAPTPAVAPAASGGTISLSVTLKSPVNYQDLLQFTYDIEQNLPKMKIKGLAMSSGGGAPTGTTGQPVILNPGQVSIEPLTIEMYIN